MTEWYYSDAQRQQHGPVGPEHLANLHARGLLPAETLVWREGMSEWKPWREMMREVVVGGMPEDPRAEALVRAAEAAPDDGAYRPYAIAERSPYAPPTARVEAAAAVVHGGHVVYAAFWKRFAALVIDNFLLGIVGGILGAVIGFNQAMSGDFGGDLYTPLDLFVQILSMLIGACYFGWMYSSSRQASLGKMAVGIKVVRTDGSAIGFWRGFARYFAAIPSALLLLIGYLMAAFTERKQTLHDMMCDTLVVDRYAYTEHWEQQQEGLDAVTIVILVLFGLFVLGMLALLALTGVALLGMSR
jgi:uncharacterized RDD family membrane protein YckC